MPVCRDLNMSRALVSPAGHLLSQGKPTKRRRIDRRARRHAVLPTESSSRTSACRQRRPRSPNWAGRDSSKSAGTVERRARCGTIGTAAPLMAPGFALGTPLPHGDPPPPLFTPRSRWPEARIAAARSPLKITRQGVHSGPSGAPRGGPCPERSHSSPPPCLPSCRP